MKIVEVLKKFKNKEFRKKFAIVVTLVLFLLGTFLPYVTIMFN